LDEKEPYKGGTRSLFGITDCLILANIFSIPTSNIYGVTILNIFSTLLIFYTLITSIKKLNKKQIILAIISILGMIASIDVIWDFISSRIYNIIQYPRYLYLSVLCLILIVCNNLNSNRLTKILTKLSLTFCLMDALVAFVVIPIVKEEQGFEVRFTWNYEEEVDYFNNQVMSGEYLQSNFKFTEDDIQYYSYHVSDQNGNEYEYKKDNPYGSVTVNNIETDNEELHLTFPKIYYKGYVAYDENGNKYKITDGYSQYCEVIIPPNTNIQSLTIIYNHPIWLRIWDLFCLVLVIILTIYQISKRNQENRKEKKQE
jgi:hypothetical protein